MAKYILDTGILVGYIRGALYAQYVEERFSVFSPPNIGVISVVSVAEMLSLANCFGWGNQKRERLKKLLSIVPQVGIHPQIIEKYAEVDSYSQCRHPEISSPEGMSARNMGKNDIWIAATGAVINATLLTTDHNFDHLHGVFLDVQYIDQSLRPQDPDDR